MLTSHVPSFVDAWLTYLWPFSPPLAGTVCCHLQALTNNTVSVFEMITSGAVTKLTDYMQGSDLPDSPQKDEQLLCRLRNFTSVGLAAHEESATGSPGSSVEGSAAAAAAAAACGGGGAAAVAVAAASSVPLTALVRKLQGALASSEAFPVMCSRLVPSGGAMGGSGRSLGRSAGLSGSFSRSTLSSGLHALTQPFKLRLVRHDQVGAEQTAAQLQQEAGYACCTVGSLQNTLAADMHIPHLHSCRCLNMTCTVLGRLFCPSQQVLTQYLPRSPLCPLHPPVRNLSSRSTPTTLC